MFHLWRYLDFGKILTKNGFFFLYLIDTKLEV